MDTGIGSESVDWIHLAQDRVQMHVLVEIVMNFQVSWKMGDTSTSSVALFSIELVTCDGEMSMQCR
jgi:hypothetical protein